MALPLRAADAPAGGDDPRALLRATAAARRRRERSQVLLPALPPAAALLAAAIGGKLPLELAWAAALSAAVILLLVASAGASDLEAADFLDHALGGRAHFLTLASVRHAPFLPLVEEGARELSRGGGADLPPIRRAPLWLAAALSAIVLALLWLIPSPLPSDDLSRGLDAIAAELHTSSDATDRRLGTELAELAKKLRDPSRSRDEKKKDIEEMRANLGNEERSGGSGGGAAAKQGAGQSQQGQEHGAGSGARGKAQKELERVSGELEGESQGGKGEAKGEKKSGDGGGLKGPSDGAKKQKEGDGADGSNQAASGQQAKQDPSRSGQSQGGSEQKSSEAKSPQAQGAEQQGQQQNQQGPDGGSGSGSSRPVPGPETEAERYYEPGASGDGAIENGRYVRVRVPEAGPPVEDVERIERPGDAAPETPYGNAPFAGPGSAGEVSEEQPVPLEYRDVLSTPTANRR